MGKFARVSASLGFDSTKQFRTELLILLAVCAAAAAWGVYQFSQFDFTRLCRGFDLWFDSDPARTISNLTSRRSVFHERSHLHPLYALLIAGPFITLQMLLGLSTSTLVTIYVGVQAAFLTGVSYVAMRVFGLARLDALLGVLLLHSTAAAIYWIGVPEWLTFGAVTVVISLIWIAAPERFRNYFTGVAQNLISGSVMLTSWGIGMAASLVSNWPKLSWKQAIRHTMDALAIMAALTVIQYALFPASEGFLRIWRQVAHEVSKHPGLILLPQYTVEFFGQTLLAPNPSVLEGPRTGEGWAIKIMTSERQGVPLTFLTVAGFTLWISLWAYGVFTALRGGLNRTVLWFTLGTVAYFFVLHIALGEEMFLFAIQYVPFMTFVALWGLRSQRKNIVRALCAALIVVSSMHNYSAFSSAVAVHNRIDLSWLEREFYAAHEVARTDCR